MSERAESLFWAQKKNMEVRGSHCHSRAQHHIGQVPLKSGRVPFEQNSSFPSFCGYWVTTLSNCFLLTKDIMMGAVIIIRMVCWAHVEVGARGLNQNKEGSDN